MSFNYFAYNSYYFFFLLPIGYFFSSAPPKSRDLHLSFCHTCSSRETRNVGHVKALYVFKVITKETFKQSFYCQSSPYNFQGISCFDYISNLYCSVCIASTPPVKMDRVDLLLSLVLLSGKLICYDKVGHDCHKDREEDIFLEANFSFSYFLSYVRCARIDCQLST